MDARKNRSLNRSKAGIARINRNPQNAQQNTADQIFQFSLEIPNEGSSLFNDPFHSDWLSW